jgi:hypothetical protein
MILEKTKRKELKANFTIKIYTLPQMQLNTREILSELPEFELSYEIMGHKKVLDANIVMAIPEGKKGYVWFTTYKNENVCVLLPLDEENHICNDQIKICLASFKDELCYGTIVYGTIFYCNNYNSFCIEDIIMHKGKMMNHYKFINKLNIMIDLFHKKYIGQTIFHASQMMFGLPIMNTKNDFQQLLRDIDNVPYKIDKIKFKYYETKKVVWIKYFKPGNHGTTTHANSVEDVVFKVTADIQNDIYHLFVYDNENDGYHDVAFIPDYKTSVMMNGLFRKIKENINLDALEESDDEEEFESENIDKFVDLKKALKMKCKYNHKFKKWVPISLANNSDKMVTRKYLRNMVFDKRSGNGNIM